MCRSRTSSVGLGHRKPSTRSSLAFRQTTGRQRCPSSASPRPSFSPASGGAGVPLQRIRPAVEVLEKEIGVDHALASKRLYTDGAEVLFDYANKRGEREVMELVVVRT